MSTRSDSSRKSLLWLVAVGFFMQTLDATIINTALPAMAASLGESPLRMQSVVVAYSLTMAMLIPASGWIADRFGTRRVFFSAIVLFVLGSVLCALSRGIGATGGGARAAGHGRRAAAARRARSRCCARCRAPSSCAAMSFVADPGPDRSAARARRSAAGWCSTPRGTGSS